MFTLCNFLTDIILSSLLVSDHHSTWMESSILKVLPISLNEENSFISINASRTTRTFEVLQRTLEKLQVQEDPALFELYVGHRDEKPSWELIVADDFPVQVLDSSRKSTNKDMSLLMCKRISLDDQLGTIINDPRLTEVCADVADLCQLNDLNESSMLRNLQARFEEGMIYTYIGSILISINPYHRYPIYNPKYSNDYQNKRLGELDPHIFAIADDAYNSMLRDKMNQSVIISGESGAGKTESTKFLLHQLMKLSSKLEETSSLELITLGTGPVLEVQ